MIGTKQVQTDNTGNKPSPYIMYGVGEYKINSFEIRTAGTGAKRVMMNMESRPVTEDGFEGVDGAKGRIGRVYLTSWMNKSSSNFETALGHMQRKVAEIADALGVREEVDKVEGTTLDDYINKISPILVNQFTNWCISADEYNTTDEEGNVKKKFTLTTPLYAFVSSEADRLTFDKSNKYHFNPAEEVVDESTTTSGGTEW